MDVSKMETGRDRGLDGAGPVDRAAALLGAFDRGEWVGLSALARRVGLPKSSAYRLLGMLERTGMVQKRGPSYALGMRLSELGSRVPLCEADALLELSVPHLVDLCGRAGETVHLAIPDRTDVFVAAKLHAPCAPTVPTSVGARLPAHCTALGKVLLAFSPREVLHRFLVRPRAIYTGRTLIEGRVIEAELARVRQERVAYDREELLTGLGCTAVPVLGERGAMAAVSLSGRSDAVGRHRAQLAATADAISVALATKRPAPRSPTPQCFVRTRVRPPEVVAGGQRDHASLELSASST
ncbi:MAG: IclR family transcriptional regulator [Acidimicrobiaceae bacterium]|nr:IclR family transcriptional regulator [Acidimicrobiaceae bacterium]